MALREALEWLRTVEMLVSSPTASRGNSYGFGALEATYYGNVGFVTDCFVWK